MAAKAEEEDKEADENAVEEAKNAENSKNGGSLQGDPTIVGLRGQS